MAEEKKLKKHPDPEMLKKLHFLRKMKLLQMMKDLHMIHPAEKPKSPAPKKEAK